MTYNQILYNVADRVLTIILNRPDKLNAFTATMFDEFLDALERGDADDNVRAIVVTGAGRAFCAGADLEMGADTFNADAPGGVLASGVEGDETSHAPRWDQLRDLAGQLTLRIFACRKPVIAAINGPAVGAGATITLAMDKRIATDSAKMGFVFARRGIVADGCSSWFLPRIVGINKALDWMMTGRVFSAEEAKDAGLVESLHESADLLEEAYGWAKEVVDNTSAVSVGLIRQLLWQTSGMDHPIHAHKAETRGVYYTGKSEDAKEGVEAFLHKRTPQYTAKLSTDFPDLYEWRKEPTFE